MAQVVGGNLSNDTILILGENAILIVDMGLFGSTACLTHNMRN